MLEHEAKELLRKHQSVLDFNLFQLARNNSGEGIGFPVVLKVVSHKLFIIGCRWGIIRKTKGKWRRLF